MQKSVKKKKPALDEGGLDWPAIKRRYDDHNVPLTQIADDLGVTWQKLANYAGRAGWTLRQKKTEARKASDLMSAALMPTKLAARLKRLIAREIDAIEAEHLEDRPAAERERDARRLASLVRSLDKLNDIKASKNSHKKKPDATKQSDTDLRAELVRRIARLDGTAGQDKLCGKPEQEGNQLAE
tara:strand:- start:219116 stop:219667 length:552 start_codon:yes stop_codon:yes gene_type:complete